MADFFIVENDCQPFTDYATLGKKASATFVLNAVSAVAIIFFVPTPAT